MELQNVIAQAAKMFPNANIGAAVKQAQQAINGTPDNLGSVAATAQSVGLNAGVVQDLYSKYGNTMQARALCGMLGTTPEALKADAETILGGATSRSSRQVENPKFPRLK
jgi:hypothetical protein